MKLVISRPKGNNFSGKGLYIDSSDLVELFSTNQRRLQNILCLEKATSGPLSLEPEGISAALD